MKLIRSFISISDKCFPL